MLLCSAWRVAVGMDGVCVWLGFAKIKKVVYCKHMARRKSEERNVRSLFKLAGGKSYAITIPIETVREWDWQERQKLKLTIDEKKKRIIVEDWSK